MCYALECGNTFEHVENYVCSNSRVQGKASKPLWDRLPAKSHQNWYIRIWHDLDHANTLGYDENHVCIINIMQDMASGQLRGTHCPSEIEI